MRIFIYMVIGILFIAFGAYNLYGGYELEKPLIAALGFGSIILGAILALFGVSKRRAGKASTMPQEETTEEEIFSETQQEQSGSGRAEYKALIQSMGVVAVADKRIRKEEINTIKTIYSEMLGLRIDDTEVREILSEFDDHFDIENMLQQNQSQISPMMKRTIIQCCQKIMVSDLEVDPSEQKRIKEIGLAMGLTETEIEHLVASAS